MSQPLVSKEDLPDVIENLRAMKTLDVAAIYRQAEFNLYPNSGMMLAANELARRMAVPPEILPVLKQGLKVLRDEVYAAEAFDQEEEYKKIYAAEAWLEDMK